MVGQEVHDAPGLLLVALGVGLEGVHHVGELHAVAHKKDLWKTHDTQAQTGRKQG